MERRLLVFAVSLAAVSATDYDALIAAAHNQAETNRAARLDHWAEAALLPIPDCKHFNIQNGAGVCVRERKSRKVEP